MFKNRNRGMVITATTCSLLEDVRLALEVLYESRIRFKHIHLEKDLDSGKAVFYLGNREIEVHFESDEEFERVVIRIDESEYSATFAPTSQAILVIRLGSNVQDCTGVTGTSFADRRTVHFA